LFNFKQNSSIVAKILVQYFMTVKLPIENLRRLGFKMSSFNFFSFEHKFQNLPKFDFCKNYILN